MTGETCAAKRLALAAALVLAALGLAAPAAPAHAEWPDKPVRVIVAYAAGGANDLLGRVFADQLSKTFGQHSLSRTAPAAAA